MKTQPTQGVAIEPIVYPLNAGTATQMSVLILNFTTEATTCTTYWQLLTEVTSAIVNVDSTTKGFLPPRMTTTQRNAITSPAAGLVVYDNTDNKHYGYNGTTWNAFY